MDSPAVCGGGPAQAGRFRRMMKQTACLPACIRAEASAGSADRGGFSPESLSRRKSPQSEKRRKK